ncbi:MAG: class I SAM-dependent methyltransferase, partial [Methylovulum sp.]
MRWDAEKYDSAKAPQIDAGKELIAMAQVCDSESILDVGCGTGKLTVELARLSFKGDVIGVDSSPEMLKKARKVSWGIENVHLVQIAAQSIDFVDKFDLAFSNSALQWVKEQREAIRRVYRALNRGGRIA